MKKTILLAFLFSFQIAGHTQSKTPKIYAIVVGIAKYADANIPTLKYADKDANSFYEYLRTPAAGAVPADNIVLLTNEKAKRSTILREFVNLLSRSTPEDMMIFYFSGHGKNDVLENSGYLLTYDTENDNEAGSAISMADVASKLERCKAKMKVSYVDACHAGLFRSYGTKGTATDNGEIAKAYTSALMEAGDGNIAFLASSARQQSLENDALSQGVFTHFLIRGLKGEADKAQKDAGGFDNGIVTTGELQTYLTSKIEEFTKYKQKPTVTGEYDEEFPLSIVKPGVNLSSEITKRRSEPKKATAPVEPAIRAEVKAPADEKLPDGMAVTGQLCHGQYVFINSTSSPVLLYAIKTRNQKAYPYGGSYEVNLKIAPSANAPTPRLYVVKGRFITTIDECSDLFDDYDFYFMRTNTKGATEYATVTTTVESRKKKYFVLSEDNMAFSSAKPTLK